MQRNSSNNVSVNVMKRLSLVFLAAMLAAGACVDHRPIRNGLRNEAIYLDKGALTSANPKDPDSGDPWLFKMTAVGASSPNILGDYVFPGLESDTMLTRFRFVEDALQLVDARHLQLDDPENPNDDIATGANDRVILEFAGEHVDVKLRESLDGERTNYLEENTEEPWQTRQKFRADLSATSLDPATQFAWFYGFFVSDCVRQVGSNLVPDSFDWDDDDQAMNFEVEVTYEVNLNAYYGQCYSLVSQTFGVGTVTVRYHFSFYRPGPSTYEPEVIDEKDPVNKKYGSFQILNEFVDPITGLLGGEALIQRWNPMRPSNDPVTYYFTPGFPPELKSMWTTIAQETNRVMEEAGATLRFRFVDFDDGGVVRHFGDLRYSWVAWHQDIEGTTGLLGYGPTAVDPRSGEAISATVNMYQVGYDWYRFRIEDYLTRYSDLEKPDEDLDWEEISCTPGTQFAVEPTNRLSAQLFQEMSRIMELPEPGTNETLRDMFLPAPTRGEAEYLENQERLLPELRYAEPGWNSYVYRNKRRMPMERLKQRLEIEREYQDAMMDIVYNGNPFGPVALHTRDGIEAQLTFRDNMRMWIKNHALLEQDRALARGLENMTIVSGDAFKGMEEATRFCTAAGKWESDEQYTNRLYKQIVFRLAIHEFGHTLSLRHNFYGSIDHNHTRDGDVTSSVMDYLDPSLEVGTPRKWGEYDEAAMKWIFGTEEVREELMEETYLYCTDEHVARSPLCRQFDFGYTPAQITLNAIESYDWAYDWRNRRAFRKFWDTQWYPGSVYNGIFPLLRMWYLSIFDWGGGGVQSTLKRLDQVEGKPVRTEQQYDEVAADFYNDLRRANGMILAFYDAVINQSASFRNYQTEFDPFYGDVLRLGIVLDKLFTTIAFMDLQEVYDYNPNIETYVAMYDAPFGTQNEALSKRVLDNMLGASYDTFPWFRYFALAIFTSVTNSDLVYDVSLKERVAIKRFNNQHDFEQVFGAGSLAEATRQDNSAQVFTFNGEEWVYTFLNDRNWHLVANRSRSPVSYQFIKDYNETLNSGADEDEDNFGLKILLAYYEYYNNFVGF